METVETTTATKAIVRQAIDYLRQKTQVHQAILFGSHAKGEADEWSDIDLAVISPNFARMSYREVMDLLVEVSLAVTPILEVRPYTPRDLQEARPTNFLGHILTEGRVVYEDDKFLL
ncbi:MAG: nucleotidyltransferase domain-containing protein [Deltaproteobacteria bacterium]|nr:nucleotidyltransferase domain-containing protein [Deltaproteobacteria bacterium]